MKKILALILTVSMLALMLTGCVGTTVVVGECDHDNVQAEPDVKDEPAETPDAPVGTESTALKTGLAVFTDVSDSASATADAEGSAAYDVVLAAVTVDEAGVIRNCVIEGIPATVKFDNTGAITSDIAAAVRTKTEMGENYGMVAWGGAIAEWDQQVAALAAFAVGKTVDELRSGAVDETGKAPAGSDLASSATIYLGSYVEAIAAAVANAQDLGAQVGDELVLATMNSVSGSTAATAEKDGTAQLEANIAVVTHKDGVITSCYIDAVQAKVTFNAAGEITSDLTAAIQTKNQLGENYGMVAWGGAIAEWNEQAASFAQYVTGKTAAEVAGIAVTETTKPAEGTDLASSVTIAVGGFQALIAKALQAPAAEGGALKTGLAVFTDVSGSASAAADAEGSAAYDVVLAAVTVDEAGVIRSCVIEGIPATVKFDNTGAITSDIAAAVRTKTEMGENYGMVAWGGAIAEWDQQVAALAAFAVGKTVDELRNGAVDETGKAPAGSDLASSATIYLGSYVEAIAAAVANAQDLGAQLGDELVLATMNSVSGSTAATAEKDGTAQLEANIAVVTHKDGVITSCYIDAVQAKVSFNAAGEITSDLTAAIQTKNQLGENYGMVAWGGAIAEWNEQAASFAQYVTGKTAAEVAGIAVTETTKPAEGTDLASSVTIAVGGFQALIAKALQK